MSPGASKSEISKSAFVDWLESIDLEAPVQFGVDDLEHAYFEAAAVLSSFSPESLKPANWGDSSPEPVTVYLQDKTICERSTDEYTECLADAVEPVIHNDSESEWTMLPNYRRDVLSQMGSREAMQRALAANPDRPGSDLQWAFEAIVNRKAYDNDEITRDQVSGLIQATSWLSGIIDDLPDADALGSLLERKSLEGTFKRLVGDHFSGRTDELRELENYIGMIETDNISQSLSRAATEIAYHVFDRPPFVIHGPGGVGKSTLVAKFILDHFEAATDQFPFAYLNFDRPKLRATQPLTLLIDAAGQLGVQYPSFADDFNEFGQTAAEYLARQDGLESSKGFYGWEEELLPYLNNLLNDAAPNKNPFIFVLDTFEEVQFFGEDVVDVIWDFLAKLQTFVPRVRPIVAGRAPVRKQILTADLPLEEFDSESAKAVLVHIFSKLDIEPDASLIDEIVQTIGGNPLTLWLAARLVKQKGIEELKSVRTRRLWLVRLKSEKIQAILHGRILKHLHGDDDDDLAKIAYPGLVVRRITPDVILNVLAKPCELEVEDLEKATELFHRLGREVALVEPAPDDPEPLTLRHRENVRRVMIDELARVKPEVTARIHTAAIRYYKERDGEIAKAEEIYHRLKQGQSARTIKKHWPADMELDSYLVAALEELNPQGRVTLAAQLGISLTAQDLKNASQEEWERAAERRVNTYLTSGRFEKALAVLDERDDEWLPGSSLYLLKVHALRGMNSLRDARVVANKGLQSLNESADVSMTTQLLLLLALIDEQESKLSLALENAEHALQLTRAESDPIGTLRAQVAVVRLLRKLSSVENDPQILRRHEEMLQKLKKGVDANSRKLPGHPALYREIIAEIGELDDKLLKRGIQNLGVEVHEDKQVTSLAKAMYEWDEDLKGKGGDQPQSPQGPIASIARIEGTDKKGVLEHWREWVQKSSGSRLSRQLVRYLDNFEGTTGIRRELTEQFRSAVDASINRSTKTRRGATAKLKYY